MYVILGNGFDLCLGLPTRYSHFLASKEFEAINDNLFADYLRSVDENSEWVDIEKELKNYASRLSREDVDLTTSDRVAARHLRSEYLNVKDSLTKYLKRSTGSLNLNNDNQAVQMVRGLVPSYSTVFNFNYTDSFEKISDWGNYEALHYVHGSVKNNDIIFGIEDDKNVVLRREHKLIKKSFASNYSQKFNASIENQPKTMNIKDVIIFGHSLGVSDHGYFKSLFNASWKGDMNLTLYHYGDEGRENMLSEIDDIVGTEMAQFRNSIYEISFVDTKI